MTNNKNFKNKSGAEWAKELSLQIENFRTGWDTEQEFNGLLLSRAEFLNRASLSVIKKPEVKSRRDAAKFLSALTNRNKTL